ncbi:MAG: aldehyde dehydrogenase [Lachnospiraceae bacterium]|nr:aldehyde dehydrogenase [Lachnospiraceae bacterium]
MNTKELVALQRQFFQSGKTLPLSFRRKALADLKAAIKRFEPQIQDALKEDLGKSKTEGYMAEIGMTLSEISYMQRHMSHFAQKKHVPTPLAQFASSSYRLPVPYGVVLIMSPWNYPFMLSMEPLVDAIAAGNTVILKPSAYSPATSAVLQSLIASVFPPEFVTVVTGGRDVNADLLEQHYDYIFFTGGKTVGRLVMEKASRNLTPVTLELGGKSPCIVDETANIRLAAKRIVFGKYLNLGQTCVAPDYLLVHSSVKDSLISAIKDEIISQYGESALTNPDYGHIVNRKHFDRLLSLIANETLITGGRSNSETLQIEPVVLEADLDSPCMQEEIFGPILPILTWNREEELVSLIRAQETPLAFYLFSSNKDFQDRMMKAMPFGGGCINDTIIHLATSSMGFGGMGESGMGSYHGKCGFDTFTHYKSIVDKKTWMDLPMRYQPYKGWKEAMIRMFLK